jgi:hypothetical protein
MVVGWMEVKLSIQIDIGVGRLSEHCMIEEAFVSSVDICRKLRWPSFLVSMVNLMLH